MEMNWYTNSCSWVEGEFQTSILDNLCKEGVLVSNIKIVAYSPDGTAVDIYYYHTEELL